MKRILVIDDDHDITALLKRFLTKHGYETETAYSGAEGDKLMDSFKPDLIMLDYRLDDMDGSVFLGKIKDKNPNLPVIIITGYSDLRTAIKMVRMGAFDYITKPLIPDEILLNIAQALDEKSSAQQKTTKTSKGGFKYLFSESPQSKNLQQQIALVAPTQYAVIIYGESGAGKEGVARMIHEQSERRNGPFVAMDCGAISRELAGSELFGHEKGSFTGAVNQKVGHFEMADKGTLFLDEVGNLPYEVQTLLLRVLQEKVLRRIGNNKEQAVDARIIVASNERLIEAVHKKKFRDDLYHRLNEFQIDVLPLRKRPEDIMFFASTFLQEICQELNKKLNGFEPAVEEVFLSYPWPGNIRELKNVIKRSALLSSRDVLDLKSLPFEILNHSKISFDLNETGRIEPSFSGYDHDMNQMSSPAPQYEFAGPQLKKAAIEAEGEMIRAVLGRCNFNRSKAAQILGIDRKTLYNKMKQLKLTERINSD
ncbi:MAG: sigma-54-dependent Fis family transcriptional regulator [Bacteroidota bacterium]|nr:sigma-54-dependent Fis family transcriptional regulator [Bacteroidota bacterium]